MSYHCKKCKIIEGSIPTKEQLKCNHDWVDSKVRTNITIDEHSLEFLKFMANRYHMSVSGIIQDLVNQYKTYSDGI